MLHCSKCNKILMDVTTDGGWKLRARMVLFSPTGTTAICPACKTPNPVPVSMDGAPTASTKPVLVVKA